MDDVGSLLFREVSREGPTVALWQGRGEVSYAELDMRATLAAGALRSFGIAAGDRVGVVTKTSSSLFDALIAAARVRAVLVLLDRAEPAARLRAWCRRDEVHLLLTPPGVSPIDWPAVAGSRCDVWWLADSNGPGTLLRRMLVEHPLGRHQGGGGADQLFAVFPAEGSGEDVVLTHRAVAQLIGEGSVEEAGAVVTAPTTIPTAEELLLVLGALRRLHTLQMPAG